MPISRSNRSPSLTHWQPIISVFLLVASVTAQELPTTYSYKPGLDTLNFYENRWTDTLARQYLDAVLAGLSFNTSSDHATDCYLQAYVFFDSFNGLQRNITGA